MLGRPVLFAFFLGCTCLLSAQENSEQPSTHLPTSISDPQQYLIGNMLSTAQEERALEAMLALMREGKQQEAMQLFYGLHGYRNNRYSHSGISSDLKDEKAFDRQQELLSKKWTNLLLSFQDPQESDYAVYQKLMRERRRATKSLYRSLAGLRYLNRQIEIGSEARLSQRALLAESILASDTADASEIERMLKDVDDSLADATRQLPPGYADNLRAIHNADLAQVVSLLPDRCAIVEFVEHELIFHGNTDNSANETPQTRYTAFVIRKDTSPTRQAPLLAPTNQVTRVDQDCVSRIDLGGQESITTTAHQWLREVRANKTSNTSSQLSTLLWKPIERLLGDVNTVYVVADGVLHDLPWDALPIDDGKRFLVEKYQLAELPFCEYLLQALESGRIDRVASNLHEHPKNLLVVGGVSADLVFGSAINKHLVSACPAGAVVSLEGNLTTVKNVTAFLPDFSLVHFSTHGMFAQSALDRARRLGTLDSLSPQQALLFSFLNLCDRRSKDCRFQRCGHCQFGCLRMWCSIGTCGWHSSSQVFFAELAFGADCC